MDNTKMPDARLYIRAKMYAYDQYLELITTLNDGDLYSEEKMVGIIERAYTEGAMNADLVPQWIKCSERMPEMRKMVDIAVSKKDDDKDCEVGVGYIRNDGEWCSRWNFQPIRATWQVTHWRERPQYPTEEV